jgi:hypothetical protein
MSSQNLSLAALLALALGGCGSSSGPGDGGAPSLDGSPDGVAPGDRLPLAEDLGSNGQFALQWGLVWVGVPNFGIGCEQAGTPTIVLRATDARGQTTVDRFPCSDRGGRSSVLPPGTYDLVVSVLDEKGTVLASASLPHPLIIGQVTDLGQIVFELQSFHITWDILRAGQRATCADVGGQMVQLVTRLAGGPEVIHSFPCTDGGATTEAIPMGIYAVSVRLIGAAGAVLWYSDPMTVDLEDDRPGDLPSVTFPFP